MDISILWEDQYLIIVNKPPGLLSIQDGYNRSLPHLHGLMKEQYGPLWIVHRLDRDTSGIMLFARTAQAHRDLNLQFEQRTIKKEYHALVIGCPAWDEKEINAPLRVNGDRKHRTIIDPIQGKPAVTFCRVIERFPNNALVEAITKSGYTHQIRTHLCSIGHPLLGDPLYQTKKDACQPITEATIPGSRTALHAFQVTFDHPYHKDRRSLQAQYPRDFQTLIESLR